MSVLVGADRAENPGELDGFTVCIVGLGLMGGSLGLALRGRSRRVLGVARRLETAKEAVDLGAADEAFTEMSQAVGRADIVVLAAPVRTILSLLPEAARLMRPGAVLTDLGSTKAEIASAMERLRADVEVVGGHPLCGRETSGLPSACGDLFRDRAYVLTPLARTGPRTLATMRRLAIAVGARPVVMDPARHDRLVGAISHAPYALAACLAALAGAAAAEDDAVWQLASSGFRDTTRLSASGLEMMEDILLTNRGNVAALARSAADWLGELAAELDEAAELPLHQRLVQARATIQAYRAALPDLSAPGDRPGGSTA